MDSWKMTLQPTPLAVRLLLTDHHHNEVLKAALPPVPAHPRAALGLLETLALWVGRPITAAISAEASGTPQCGEALFADGLLPAETALVRFEPMLFPRPRRTLAGLGDFRQLRLIHGRWS